MNRYDRRNIEMIWQFKELVTSFEFDANTFCGDIDLGLDKQDEWDFMRDFG